MYEERRKFPVFAQKELQRILDRLGLLEQMRNGELECWFCNETMSEQNFGAIFLVENVVRVSCSNPRCLEQIPKVIEQ